MQPPSAELRQRTWLHRASPRLKLGAALALVIGTTLLPRHPDALYVAPAGVVLLLWVVSRMPLRYALRRLVLAEFFILGFGVLALVSPSSMPLFLSLVMKSSLCVTTLLVLTWTTPFHELLQVLRRMRFPSVMLTTLALMYRYFPVLAEESRRMQRARASRTFSRSRRQAWGSLSAVVGHLFIRSAERAERIYLAMCSRGWK
jgi:cobalt/nickel transport system permease protein